MADEELRDRANDAIERLFALDKAMENVDAFCALLKDLRGRDLSAVSGPHALSIHMVRSGILRAAVGTVMACLDPEDWRGNRASVGQILDAFKDITLVDYLERVGRGSIAGLQQARASYERLRKSDLFERGRKLRNVVVAHNLLRDPGVVQAPLDYEDIYELANIAEQILTELYKGCGRGEPGFLYHRTRLVEHAKIFWDTYFVGMRSA